MEMGMGEWKKGCTARIHVRVCFQAAQCSQTAIKKLRMCREAERLRAFMGLFLFFTKSSKPNSQKLLLARMEARVVREHLAMDQEDAILKISHDGFTSHHQLRDLLIASSMFALCRQRRLST